MSAEDEPTRGIAAGIAKGHTRTRGRAGEDKNAPRRGRNYLTRAYKLLSEIRIKIEHQQSWHRLPIQLGPERSSVFFFSCRSCEGHMPDETAWIRQTGSLV